MRDPHVVALHYRLETGPRLGFKDPPPVERKTNSFSLRLANGQLRAEIRDDPATVVAAYRELEQYIRSWEILTNLRYGSGTMRLRLEKTEVVDASPGAELSEALKGLVVSRGTFTSFSVSDRPTLTQYPDTPERFVATSDVVNMWERYDRYANGRELLTDVAWWCLTTIDWLSGGRPQAEARYAISENVLKALQRLAHVGDERTARKRFSGQDLRAHTPAEIAWMEAVVKRIIQRVGEWAADPTATWPQITMEDFPRL
jgi:hypothetical protein